jgi:hypothetical protein
VALIWHACEVWCWSTRDRKEGVHGQARHVSWQWHSSGMHARWVLEHP